MLGFQDWDMKLPALCMWGEHSTSWVTAPAHSLCILEANFVLAEKGKFNREVHFLNELAGVILEVDWWMQGPCNSLITKCFWGWLSQTGCLIFIWWEGSKRGSTILYFCLSTPLHQQGAVACTGCGSVAQVAFLQMEESLSGGRIATSWRRGPKECGKKSCQ